MKGVRCKSVVSLCLVIVLISFTLRANEIIRFDGATPLQWSVRMADSEIARCGDSLAWKNGGTAKWDYTTGLFTLALLKLNEKMPHARYVWFATNAISSFILDYSVREVSIDGLQVSDAVSIRGYKVEEYQLDALNSGKTALAFWRLTRDEHYKKCAALLRKQLDTQPRTSDGGFWHKQRYTNQMWLDGLYMGAPFYAECAKIFNTPEDFDDVAKQFQLVDRHLYDAKSGLFYHGWDAEKVQGWANPATGASSNFWGRAVGWYAMACVDVLDFLPANHPARKEIIDELKKVSDGIVKWQDAGSGLWWQVMDQGGRDGNYLEASASAMFVYSLAKGVNRGYLSRDYVPVILKGYKGIITKFIKTDGGKISLAQCCQVAGLGNFGGKNRDGSFSYYVSEPIVENDLKGVGPFILAGIEVQQLAGSPPNK
jgi:unsaturated rhamnogalacturonyl hydrolase